MNPRFVTIKRFAELTGYSGRAVEGKMHRGDWLEGREFRKAPDGRILMDLEAFERWVLGESAGSGSPAPGAARPGSSLKR